MWRAAGEELGAQHLEMILDKSNSRLVVEMSDLRVGVTACSNAEGSVLQTSPPHCRWRWHCVTESTPFTTSEQKHFFEHFFFRIVYHYV